MHVKHKEDSQEEGMYAEKGLLKSGFGLLSFCY